MRSLSKWVLVVVVAVAAGCFSGKRGPRGTNIGTPNDDPNAPTWEGGGGGGTSPAHVSTP
jgi:hypothetical protein